MTKDMSMRVRRLLVLAAAVLAASAGPVEAHEELSPPSLPTGKPGYLILSASNEKQVDLNRVVISAPPGGEFGHATRDPPGWTANQTHTRITWTGGAIRPGRFEQFGFDVGGFGQPGTIVYKVTVGYVDGSSADVDVPMTAVAAGAPAPAPTPSVTAVPTTSVPEPAPVGGADTTVPPASDSADSGTATVLSGVALAVSVAALALALRRRAPSGAAAPADGGQDW